MILPLRPGQRLPQRLHLLRRLGIQRRQPEVRLSQRAQAVINPGVNVHDVAVLFDRLDSRQEARALQAVAIEILRRNIRRGDQRNATGKQRLHQAA